MLESIRRDVMLAVEPSIQAAGIGRLVIDGKEAAAARVRVKSLDAPSVAVFAGEAGNTKLTTEDDFTRAEARRLASLADLRTGSGFDVHAFADGPSALAAIGENEPSAQAVGNDDPGGQYPPLGQRPPVGKPGGADV